MKNLILLLMIFLFSATDSTAAAGEDRYWNFRRGYQPFQYATPDGLVMNNESAVEITDGFSLSEAAESLRLTFRAANRHGNPAKRYPFVSPDGIIRKKGNTEWGFFLYNTLGDTLFFRLHRTEQEKLIGSESAGVVTASYTRSGLMQQATSTEIDSHTGFNLWQVNATPSGVSLSGGSRRQNKLMQLPPMRGEIAGFGFFAGAAANVAVTDITLHTQISTPVYLPVTDIDELADYFRTSDDPYEGFWVMFDRDLDESLLRPGGDYMLAIVSQEGNYRVIYIEGASVNSSSWKKGMTKAMLYPTHFEGIFDAEWIDAEGQPISNGVKAQSGEGETLSFQFPYHSSSLRLRKVPLKSLNQTNRQRSSSPLPEQTDR